MSICFKHLRYNNVCLKLNESSEDVLCTDNDFGFDGDDGNDLITWTLPRERITKGIDVLRSVSCGVHSGPTSTSKNIFVEFKNIYFKVELHFQNPEYPAQITDLKIYYKECFKFTPISDFTVGIA